VIAQDTQRPARFVMVMFQSVADVTKGGLAAFGSSSASARTDQDGTFTANVAPGDYYVMAVATGYIQEGTLLQIQAAAGADPVALLARVPTVHVTAEGISNVLVPIERGGAIAGHMEWEDGSPAAGVQVRAESTVPQVNTMLMAGTDDRGNFRIAGVASGDYVLEATLGVTGQQNYVRGPSISRAQMLTAVRVFGPPGVFRRGDVKPVTVRAGEDRGDVRIVLNMSQLRTVSGTLVSADPAVPVASGRVTLIDTNDSTLQIAGSIGDHGVFRLTSVPPGTYTLRASGSSSQSNSVQRAQRGSAPAVTFQPFSQTQVVGDSDVSGVAVSLTPVQSKTP